MSFKFGYSINVKIYIMKKSQPFIYVMWL